MSALGSKLRQGGDGFVSFHCPGCDGAHYVRVRPTDKSPSWEFNGNGDAPTFSPSILLRSGHFLQGGGPGNCWCDMKERLGLEPDFECVCCHSFVTDGRIQFLSDCSHALAGQTVDLPNFPAPKVIS